MELIAYLQTPDLEKEQNQAIRETVRRERSKLLAFIRRRLPDGDGADAEDVLQDVFYELTEMYRLMKPVEQAAAWLFRVARNKITDRARKKKPERLDEALHLAPDGDGDTDEPLLLADLLPAYNASPEDELLRQGLLEALENALEDLPEEQRRVFVQHELEGISFKTLSAQTGLPVNTLISRKRYAVLYLREQLRGWYDEMLEN